MTTLANMWAATTHLAAGTWPIWLPFAVVALAIWAAKHIARRHDPILDRLIDGDDWAAERGYMPPAIAAHIAAHAAADIDTEWAALDITKDQS